MRVNVIIILVLLAQCLGAQNTQASIDTVPKLGLFHPDKEFIPICEIGVMRLISNQPTGLKDDEIQFFHSNTGSLFGRLGLSTKFKDTQHMGLYGLCQLNFGGSQQTFAGISVRYSKYFRESNRVWTLDIGPTMQLDSPESFKGFRLETGLAYERWLGFNVMAHWNNTYDGVDTYYGGGMYISGKPAVVATGVSATIVGILAMIVARSR